jgi:hypothetical protein
MWHNHAVNPTSEPHRLVGLGFFVFLALALFFLSPKPARTVRGPSTPGLAWAVESVLDSGAQVDAAALTAALERFRQRSIEDLATISYSDTDHRPQSTARVYTVGTTGRLEAVGQPISIALEPDWLGW